MSPQIIYPTEPLKRDPMPKKGEPWNPPTTSLWFAHDPALFRDPVSGDYFVYCTEGKARRSKDMITWEKLGKVVECPPEAKEWTNSEAIWAPDIVKVGEEYRLYCSNSSWGVRQSCIFLAVADKPEGPFTSRGIVFRSSDKIPVNGIDAGLITDHNTGQMYMVYGSFWGGCHIIELDPTTGLALNGPDDFGKCLARRPLWADGAIEGPYIVYNKDTDYYYLFVSYASLKSDYNIRVGRSKCVTGPYLDHNGRDMTDLNDVDNTLGYMICCGYKFDDDETGWMGPGHNSVLQDFDGQWYLCSHIRPKNFKEGAPSTMHIRKMLWTTDGWPVASPEEYAGEYQQPVTTEQLVGKYERIRLQPMVPQGTLTSVRMSLFDNGHGMLADSIRFDWEQIDGTTIRITYAATTEELKVMPAWDYEAWKPTLILTGTDDKHICIWGKKYSAT